MDGLKISTGENLIETGQTFRQMRDSKIRNEVLGPLPNAQGIKPDGANFGDTLKNAIQSVNQLQVDADKKMQDLATGKAKSIPDVMIATEKADIAFKLMMQVRNKIIEAYQEIMKMQV